MMRRHIHQALQILSKRERSVFVLRHYNDLPLQEIAQILQISLGTVKSLLFRTIRKLQRELVFYHQELDLEE
jgi:RNA polymerase sigma-70 factor (ECF subfamily)